MLKLNIPSNALVVLVGVSGSGKSTFARRCFPVDSIVSSDKCRRLIKYGSADVVCPEDDLQQYSDAAFLIFHNWIRGRLKHNLLTVADATNTTARARSALVAIAKEQRRSVVYIVLSMPIDQCISNDSVRLFPVGEEVINRQSHQLTRDLTTFNDNDHQLYVLDENNIKEEIVIEYIAPCCNASVMIPAPYQNMDVIGDIHGCLAELKELLLKLDYSEDNYGLFRHPHRIFVLVGDVIDRGPDAFKVLQFIKHHIDNKLALMVSGNHEYKFAKYLVGKDVKITNALQATINQYKEVDTYSYTSGDLAEFLFKLPPYLVYQNKAVITHAAFKEEYLGMKDKKVRDYCMYGPSKGVDANGLPYRIPWEDSYTGSLKIVYGHQVTVDRLPKVTNNTYGIDTGVVFGGQLTALRVPEFELVSVPAKQVYVRYQDKD